MAAACEMSEKADKMENAEIFAENVLECGATRIPQAKSPLPFIDETAGPADRAVSVASSIQRQSQISEPQDQLNTALNMPRMAQTNCSKLAQNLVVASNCKEKIIFCVDMSDEMDVPIGRSSGSAPSHNNSCISIVKHALKVFVARKIELNPRHEFSLCALYDTPTFIKQLNSNPTQFGRVLDESLKTTRSVKQCDLSPLFKIIKDIAGLPEVTPEIRLRPPFVVRCILVYGRRHIVPRFDLSAVEAHPLLFFDAVYVHEPRNEFDDIEVGGEQAVFDALLRLTDLCSKSYVFNITRHAVMLHNTVAKLLAHPLQRPIQYNASYGFREPIRDEDREF